MYNKEHGGQDRVMLDSLIVHSRIIPESLEVEVLSLLKPQEDLPSMEPLLSTTILVLFIVIIHY